MTATREDGWLRLTKTSGEANPWKEARTGYTTVDPSEGEQAKPCYPDPVAGESLKPCPFCGGDSSEDNACQSAKVHPVNFTAPTGQSAWRVQCACGTQGQASLAYVEAVAAWNRRAPDPVMDAVRRCAEIAHSWETSARKLAAATDMMEKRLPHLVAADMANDITASIRAEFGLLPTSET